MATARNKGKNLSDLNIVIINQFRTEYRNGL